MSGISSKNIDDIKNLYESVVEENTTDIDEGFWRDRGADLRNAALNVGNAITSSADAAIQGVQGKKIPENKRKVARLTNATVRGTRDVILDFSKGLSTGEKTPQTQEELYLDNNLIAEAPQEGDPKVINGKTYYWNGSRYVDPSGKPAPSSTPTKPKPYYGPGGDPSGSGKGQEQKIKLKPLAPITIKNTQGKTQQVIPGKGYSYTKPDGTRGYMVYDNKGAGKFTAYPDKSPVPPAAPPVAEPSGPRNDRRTAPPAAPARQTPPQASPVAQYMKAAAAARKSGDPAEMAKVRDMGLQIWASTPANKKLAAAAAERERIRGTAQTDNPLMKDMRDRLPLTPTVQSPAVKTLGTGQQSLSQNPNAAIAATPKPTIQPVEKSQFSNKATPEMNQSAKNLSDKPLKKPEVKKEAYDIVLDYLLSEGHVDTIDEANYVMLQMSAEHIQNIVEAENYVLAQRTRNGVTVPGIVKVNKTREGGFLGIGSREVSRPVPGSFEPGRISSRAAARYNQAIDQRFGTGSNRNAMPAYRVQQRAQNQGNSGYMRVDNPEAIPNTGAADRPTPQRAGDQNRALDLLRPDVPVDTRNTAPLTPKPVTKSSTSAPKSTSTFQNTGGYGKYAPPSTQVKIPTPAPKPAAPETKAPEPKVKAKLAPKPAAPESSSEPKVKAKLAPKPAAPAPEPRLTKAQQDILDLRQMRAGSLSRQGDVAAAQKLQTEVDVARAEKKMPPKEK